MNKKYKLVFITYLIFIISITIFLSTNIIEKKYTGGFSLNNNCNLTGKMDFAMPSKNPLLHTQLVPNYTGIFYGFNACLKSTKIDINSDGFRDREFSIQKPNYTFRIVVLGDSFAFGWGVDLDESYPKQLERKLNALNNGIRYEVLNLGVPAFNTLEKVEIFKEKGIKYNPDMVILDFLNDDVRNLTRLTEIQESLIKNKKMNNIDAISTSFILHDDELRSKPFGEIWKIVEDSLNELMNITKKKNITLIVFLFGYNEQQYTALSELLKKNDIYFIDYYGETIKFTKDPKFDPSLYIINSIDTHPNALYYHYASERILKEILLIQKNIQKTGK